MITADEPQPHDPVHEEPQGWFFWDETWGHRLGPFESEGKAREALRRYADYLDGTLLE